MNKADIKKAYKASLKDRLVKVEGLPFECYVKKMSVSEMNAVMDLTRDFQKKYDDGMNDARSISVEIFDEKGELIFDFDDVADMQFLNDMLFTDRQRITRYSREANDFLS